jgi:predicted outer membrane repeat protein
MKKLFTYLVVFFIPVMQVLAVGEVMYVTPDGSGDGSSWENASGFAAAAEVARVQEVKPQIWVKAGTYDFTSPVNFDDLFIYGGFNGTETALSERNWVTNQTIFDGNDVSSILRNTTGEVRPGGNTASIDCLLDGVIMQNGLSPTDANGGAMIINNGAVIRNCIFRNNATQESKHGGAIHCHVNTLTIENSLFINNTSSGNGGAVQVGGGTTLTVRSCTFANNQAVSSGGAIGTALASSNLTLINSIAYNNLYGIEYNSYGRNNGINGGGTIISMHSAVESTSTKFTEDLNDVNHIVLDRNASEPVVPGFVSPASVIGKGTTPEQITEINNASYRLQSSSPCVNTGLNEEVAAISLDLGHKSRIAENVVDMGAYEYEAPNNIFSGYLDGSVSVIVSDHEMRISGGKKGQLVQLIDLRGVVLNVQELKSDNETAYFRLTNRGIYLVSVDNKVLKVRF